MFLSMILPVYNTEKYLAECLESCLSQDISPDDYEIICINDGSVDGSLDILRSYEARYPNIHVIDQPNGGVSAARNAGLDAAQGDYIWFIDSDDVICKNTLGGFYRLLCGQEQPCDLLTFQSYFFREQFTPEELALIEADRLRSNQTFSSITMHLFRRQRIGALRFHTGIAYGEDVIFIRAFFLFAPVQRFADQVVYFYRANPNSAMHTASNARLSSYVRGAMELRDIYNAPNGACEANANILIHTLNSAMIHIARWNDPESRAALAQLKRENLFPLRRPPECTARNAYTTTRTDLAGRLYNRLCLNAHTRTGFLFLRLWYFLYRTLR